MTEMTEVTGIICVYDIHSKKGVALVAINVSYSFQLEFN